MIDRIKYRYVEVLKLTTKEFMESSGVFSKIANCILINIICSIWAAPIAIIMIAKGSDLITAAGGMVLLSTLISREVIKRVKIDYEPSFVKTRSIYIFAKFFFVFLYTLAVGYYFLFATGTNMRLSTILELLIICAIANLTAMHSKLFRDGKYEHR